MKEYELGKEGRRGMNEGGRKMDKVGRERGRWNTLRLPSKNLVEY